MADRIVSVELEDLDSVPEALHGLFEQKDGKYVGKVAPAAEISEFRNTNIQLLKEKDELQKQIDELASRAGRVTDEDIKELERLRKEARKREEEELAANGDTERLREKWRAEYEQKLESVKSESQKQIEALQRERDTIAARLRRRELDGNVNALARKHLHPDYAEDAAKLLIYEGRLDLDDEGNLIVKDKDGDPASITPEEFFEKVYREERPAFYEASGGSGSGSTNNGANPNLSGSKNPLTMSTKEKAAFINKHGLAKWQAMVDTAHKQQEAEAAEERKSARRMGL